MTQRLDCLVVGYSDPPFAHPGVVLRPLKSRMPESLASAGGPSRLAG